MGRPKSYDREAVTRKAMELLWERGYHATSTKDLAQHMGINTYSLFAEFGSKQGLFESVADLYSRDIVTRVLGALEAPDAGIKELVDLLRLHASVAGELGAAKGCFMCNTATALAHIDPSSQLVFSAHVDRMQAAIRRAIENAQARGELRPEVSPADESRLITSMLLGLSVLTRARVDPEVVIGAVRAACVALERLRL